MNLIHPWRADQAYIISGLKRLLTQKPFNINSYRDYDEKRFLDFQQGIFCLMGARGEKTDPVYSWELMLNSDRLKNISRKAETTICKIILIQAFTCLFSSDGAIRTGKCFEEVYKFLFEDEPQVSGSSQFSWRLTHTATCWKEKHHAPWIYADPLPVRLQPEFMTTARQRDIAKLIFLLDPSDNPGEKPKNICCHLLNCDDYANILAFGDPAENLAKIDRSRLKLFWLNCMDETEAEKTFSRSIYPLLTFSAPWQELHDAKRMSAKLDVLLDHGTAPGNSVFSKFGLTVPLCKYFYFLDEIKEELSPALTDAYTLRDDFAAAEKFIKWEQEKHLGH